MILPRTAICCSQKPSRTAISGRTWSLSVCSDVSSSSSSISRSDLNRAEWKAAEIVAQYEHALKRANVQVADATKRNSEIIEVLVGLKESNRVRAAGPHK